MVTMTGTYSGGLHCEIIHGPSQSKIETDAPKDNNGRGEAFSPTDLVGAALGACMLTVMAIAAEKDGQSLKGSTFEVKKEMAADPRRRISRLAVVLNLPSTLDLNYRKKLETIAHTCPVHESLNSNTKVELEFNYSIS